MSAALFRDRKDAGKQLARKLGAYANLPDVAVLALPRGGVPVAHEVARGLKAPLDVFVVRKLGVPGYEELAMGAVASGGVRVLNKETIGQLGVPEPLINQVTQREQKELARREALYRNGRPSPQVRGKTVILVDDGLATGATMQAAVEALKQQGPKRIVVAVPVAPEKTCEELRKIADDVVCAFTPEPLYAVGRWYMDFSQTSDEEVRTLLSERLENSVSKNPSRLGQEDAPVARILHSAHRLTGAAEDYDPLVKKITNARLALLGEASHGTHEFYEERAEITRRLIAEEGFAAVAVEGDWPDAFRVNRYVRGISRDVDAEEALSDFRRFPSWMWRNTVLVEFVEWLRAHNDKLPAGASKVGFYGLDLYSLHASMKAVLRFLDKIEPEAARRARERYGCFDHFGYDAQVYGFMTRLNLSQSCENEVVAQLLELKQRSAEFLRRDGRIDPEEHFQAEQNARVVKNAEAYYRAMYLEEVSSWNLRDRHMMETLEALDQHLSRSGKSAKIAVWAHNSHLGDARATAMSQRGELNIGQLVREKFGRQAVLVGFTTHHGTVTAASEWGGETERKRVRPALPGSYEEQFHQSGLARFLLIWDDIEKTSRTSIRPSLERAIGVIYRPQTERQSHYFQAHIAEQFDAVIHLDETRALEPLEYTSTWDVGEAPETFPFAV
ncbi:MAG TPA: erythromycin esterase family protein [Aestuariivirgaceae bacterium]